MSDYPPRPDIFETWERLVRQEETVGIVTAENIGALAAWLRCTVDYSGDVPALVITDGDRDAWRISVGSTVKPTTVKGRPSLANMAGFNRDGDWTITERPAS